ncbi:MAG: hypothetical protein WDL87_00685 [Candidatus Omnitrophota bacterium]|jgi:hypothetical protein
MILQLKRFYLKIPVFFFLLFVLWNVFGVTRSFAEGWKEEKGEHFIVYYVCDNDFVKNVLDKAEEYYGRIASELGYSRASEFWTWDNRVKIYIYSDHEAFVRSGGHPAWSHGLADYAKKAIFSYVLSRDFLDSILPHEMTHLIFRDFVGFKGEVPLWLDEGVAQWEQAKKRDLIRAIIKKLFANDTLLSISDMMRLDIRKVNQMDKVFIRSIMTKKGERANLAISGEALVNTYYVQSASLVGFLIEKYGSLDFAQFCRQLRDGKSLAEALASVYPTQMRNVDEFELRWKEYLASSS